VLPDGQKVREDLRRVELIRQAVPDRDGGVLRVIYTDIWVSMGEPESVWAERIAALAPYQVNAALMAKADPNANFMHCLPAYHDKKTAIGNEMCTRFGREAMEVTDDVFESAQSVVFQEAENRDAHHQGRHGGDACGDRAMKRYLVLENGEVFAGLAFGAPCDTVGELVFTTGMNGYIETLTDPSYCGQIVLQTFPLIGNYGIIPADFEGKCCVRGYVVREQCQTPSNFRCEETLDAFLKANNIPGIAGIDTRAVTRILREAGTMNAAICDTVPDDLAPLRAYRITDPVPQVTTPEPYTLQPEGSVLHRVALIDYGDAQSRASSAAAAAP